MKVVKNVCLIILVSIILIILCIVPFILLDKANNKVNKANEIKKEELNLSDEERKEINKKLYKDMRYVLKILLDNDTSNYNINLVNDLSFKYNVVWYLLNEQVKYDLEKDKYYIDLDILEKTYKEIFDEELDINELQILLDDIEIAEKIFNKKVFYGVYPKGFKNDTFAVKATNKTIDKINTVYFDLYDVNGLELTDTEFYNIIDPNTVDINQERVGTIEIKYQDNKLKSFIINK